MTEFFQNNYVVKVESGHPGYRAYSIITTRYGMTELINELTQALSDSASDASSVPDEDDGLIMLLSKYATIAYGETSRVYLKFGVAKSLRSYHVRPRRLNEFWFWLGCAAVALILFLASIGLKAIASGFLHSKLM